MFRPEDNICWKGKKDGTFLLNHATHSYLTHKIQHHSDLGNKFGKALPLIKFSLTCLVAKNACLTQSNLQKRGLKICSRCPRASRGYKSPVNAQLWDMFFSILGLKRSKSTLYTYDLSLTTETVILVHIKQSYSNYKISYFKINMSSYLFIMTFLQKKYLIIAFAYRIIDSKNLATIICSKFEAQTLPVLVKFWSWIPSVNHLLTLYMQL